MGSGVAGIWVLLSGLAGMLRGLWCSVWLGDGYGSADGCELVVGERVQVFAVAQVPAFKCEVVGYQDADGS